MKKIELVRAVMEMQSLKILTSAKAFDCVKQIMEKTVTGTNKNFDKNEE